MLKIGYIILTLVIVLTFSCRSTKNVTSDKTITETKNNTTVDNYRLIVSFYSPGNGIDRKIKQKYEEFLTGNYPKIVYEKTTWGKEGEVDFCFQLSVLSEKEKEKFVKESKELLSISNRVHIYENTICKNKKKSTD